MAFEIPVFVVSGNVNGVRSDGRSAIIEGWLPTDLNLTLENAAKNEWLHDAGNSSSQGLDGGQRRSFAPTACIVSTKPKKVGGKWDQAGNGQTIREAFENRFEEHLIVGHFQAIFRDPRYFFGPANLNLSCGNLVEVWREGRRRRSHEEFPNIVETNLRAMQLVESIPTAPEQGMAGIDKFERAIGTRRRTSFFLHRHFRPFQSVNIECVNTIEAGVAHFVRRPWHPPAENNHQSVCQNAPVRRYWHWDCSKSLELGPNERPNVHVNLELINGVRKVVILMLASENQHTRFERIPNSTVSRRRRRRSATNRRLPPQPMLGFKVENRNVVEFSLCLTRAFGPAK